MTGRVYLCGPITGTTYNESALGWRKYVYDQLTYNQGDSAIPGVPLRKHTGIGVFSPMRGKDHLSGENVLSATAYDKNPVSTAQAILGRDLHDTIHADLLFVNLLGATAVSIGSVAEIAWAYKDHKPILVCIEKEGNPHEHLFITGMLTYRVHNLQDGIVLAKVLLQPGI